jgi:hypothetical protein
MPQRNFFAHNFNALVVERLRHSRFIKGLVAITASFDA